MVNGMDTFVYLGMPKATVECPVCKGSGKLPKPKHSNEQQMKEVAVRALHEAGYSHRQIMEFCGYKSTRSISVILEKK